MATILEFRAQSLRSPGTVIHHSGGTGAEIVFFPGVRYERWSDDETPARQKPRKSRRRDRLDLED